MAQLDASLQQKPIDENDPSIQLRTDLWSTMTASQLNRQREMLLDKISKLQSIMGGIPHPSILNMHSALQLGLDDIGHIIDYKMAHKR